MDEKKTVLKTKLIFSADGILVIIFKLFLIITVSNPIVGVRLYPNTIAMKTTSIDGSLTTV